MLLWWKPAFGLEQKVAGSNAALDYAAPPEPSQPARHRAYPWAINAENAEGSQGGEGKRPPPKAPERTRAIRGGRDRERRPFFRPL